MVEKLPITQAGVERLGKELVQLKNVERPAIVGAIAEAREHGDLSENAEYHSAREKQGFIEARIRELEDIMSRASVVDVAGITGDVVRFGALVKLVDEDTEQEVTYQLVGEVEADISQNLLSLTSPLGRALLGKKVGDAVEFQSPQGRKEFEVLEVSYG